VQLRAPTDLSLPRSKDRSAFVAFSYRMVRVLRAILGDRLFLRGMLVLSRLSWRLAYEASFELFGNEFPDSTYGVSPELLERWVPVGGSVIDVGCGMGRLSAMASRSAVRVLGIDSDPGRIGIAQRTHSASGLKFRLGIVPADIGEEHFDVAICVGVLEHIDDSEGLLQVLATCADVLIVEVPDFEADPLNLVRFAMGSPWSSDADHVREYTSEALRAELGRTGWSPKEWVRRGGMVLAVAERL